MPTDPTVLPFDEAELAALWAKMGVRDGFVVIVLPDMKRLRATLDQRTRERDEARDSLAKLTVQLREE